MQLGDNADADLDHLSACVAAFISNKSPKDNKSIQKAEMGFSEPPYVAASEQELIFFFFPPYETSETYYNLDTQFSYCL